MIITKKYLIVNYNKWLKRFDTQLDKQTNQNSKSPKLLIQRIRKHHYETLGTSVINSPLSPPSLELITLDMR